MTDGTGALTASQLTMLRNLYALRETDVGFPAALGAFLESLSVLTPG